MNLASHGTLAAINYQLNEMTAPMNSSRLPESQSYSQISMLNKNAMLAVARHHGSTSSSEERTGAPKRSPERYGRERSGTQRDNFNVAPDGPKMVQD